jgi:hypothetical protein
MAAQDFFISNEVELKTFPLPEQKCEKCNEQGHIIGNISLNYMSFFGIPIVPLGRTYLAVCHKCKKAYRRFTMPHEMLVRIKEQSKKVPRKWGYYFGIAVLFAVLLFFFIRHQLTGD